MSNSPDESPAPGLLGEEWIGFLQTYEFQQTRGDDGYTTYKSLLLPDHLLEVNSINPGGRIIRTHPDGRITGTNVRNRIIMETLLNHFILDRVIED